MSKLKKLLIFVFIGVICFSAYEIGSYYYTTHKEDLLQNELKNKLEFKKVKAEENTSSILDLKQLQEMNEDIFGYIDIEDSNISYPVVKGTDNLYYLSHNIKKQESDVGSIFFDYRVGLEVSFPHYIMYGHNWRSGQMFHDISNYESEEYAKNHQTITLYLEDKTYEAVVYSFYRMEDSQIKMPLKFLTEKDVSTYINETAKQSLYELNKVDSAQSVVTLVTCTNGNQEERFVLHAAIKE